MAANTSIGHKVKRTLYKKYGRDYYRKLGAMGGKASNTGGFYKNRELAQYWGIIGGNRPRHRRTKCKRGHRLTGDNLIITPKGYRFCKECKYLRYHRYYVRKQQGLVGK